MLGGLSAVAIMAAFVALDKAPAQHLIYVGVAAALIVLLHRDNIARLLSGSESKLGGKGERIQTG